MNSIDTKEKITDMWKKIFKKSRNYMLKRITEERKEW